jgi:hypothetical protein
MDGNADTVSARLSSRFVFVTLLPNVVVVAVVAAVVAAGAPKDKPSLHRVGDSIAQVDAWGWVALCSLLLIGSLAVHALQTPIIQLLEGYWHHLPFGARMATLCSQRFKDQAQRIGVDLMYQGGNAGQVRRRALERDRLMPSDQDILPTELGNVLTAGEELATGRYGIEVVVAIPRLMHVAPAEDLKPLLDRRTQLYATARLSAAFTLTSGITLGLLIPTGRWLWVPFGCIVLAWSAYRSAISAARSFGDELQVIVDLYHLDLWKALRLPVPRTLAEEVERGAQLLPLLRDGIASPEKQEAIHWVIDGTR